MKSTAPATPTARQERMRTAARDLFLEQGYRVSMDEVASRAGVSKQTVYAHYGCKRELFKSVVEDMLDDRIASLNSSGALREELVRFGRSHLRHIYAPSSIAACRVLIGEAERFPDEARALYEASAELILQRLTLRIELASRTRQLRACDPAVAAELLLGMLDGMDRHRRLFGTDARSEAQTEDWVAMAVDTFLIAFSAELDLSTRKNP